MTVDGDVDSLAAGVRSGDRRALARAITLVESTLPDDRRRAVALIEALLPATGTATRVAVTGAPGAGKSTLIEAVGLELADAGHRVAVLAIDPTSRRSGGSILGDKTRMDRLAKHPGAFIRPSPSGGSLGGIARRTREALLLCEAAGFDVVLVETVGVGQSETAAADMVDCFVLVLAPAGGDELQGIKRGIMELADVVVVNKADGDLVDASRRSASDLVRALHLLRPKYDGWVVPVHRVSAAEARGVDELWSSVDGFLAMLRADGRLEALRATQAVAWMWEEVRAELLDRFLADPSRSDASALEAEVAAGRLSAAAAAERLLGGPPVS